MKYLNHNIYLTLLLSFLFVGCDKADEILDIEPDTPAYGYILFNADKPTRVALVDDMNRPFGVMGYYWKYNNQNDIWTTVRVLATPDVFHAQKITYDDDSQLHTYDLEPSTNGTQLKPWEFGYKYTFFGYYPHETESQGTLSVSADNVQGTPYITYTLPDDVAKMQDVMTAAVYDTDYRSTREVAFTFKHRLTAVDVQMVNMNAPLENGTEVYVKVTDLKVNLENQGYDKVVIPMDDTMPLERTEAANKKKNYTIVPSVTLAPSNGESSAIVASGNPLIIIPQEKISGSYLYGTVSLSIQYVDKNGNPITVADAAVTNGAVAPISFNIERDLLPGRRYVLQLTFTRDALTLQVIPPGEWVDNRVDVEFD